MASRILVVAPQPFFSPRGTPFSVYYRCLVSAELGYEMDLLTYGQGDDVDLPNLRIIRTPALRFLGRVPTGPSLVKIVHDAFLLIWFLGLQWRHRYAVVHAHEEAVFFASLLKPLFGYRLIYDMHSSLPEQLENFNFTRSSLLKRMFAWFERFSLKKADAVITICPALRDTVERLAPWAMSKHQLIENSIFDDVRLVANSPTAADDLDALIESSGGRLKVVYCGTLEPYQGIDLLIRGFSQLGQTRSEAMLVIAGGAPEQVRHYEDLASSLGLGGDEVRFLGRVAPATARRLNRLADIIVSPRSSGTNTPLKIYEQLASGVALIATNIYSHTQVLDDRTALLVDPTPEGFAGGLKRLIDEPATRSRLATQGRLHYEEHYSKPIYTIKLRKVLELVT